MLLKDGVIRGIGEIREIGDIKGELKETARTPRWPNHWHRDKKARYYVLLYYSVLPNIYFYIVPLGGHIFSVLISSGNLRIINYDQPRDCDIRT